MARCKDCCFYEEDDELRVCNHPNFMPDPFGLDMPEDVDCDDFEKFHNKDELIIGIVFKDNFEGFI
jgi:hypothetical protein